MPMLCFTGTQTKSQEGQTKTIIRRASVARLNGSGSSKVSCPNGSPQSSMFDHALHARTDFLSFPIYSLRSALSEG